MQPRKLPHPTRTREPRFSTSQPRSSERRERERIEAEKHWLKVNPSAHDIFTMRKLPDGKVVLLVDTATEGVLGDGITFAMNSRDAMPQGGCLISSTGSPWRPRCKLFHRSRGNLKDRYPAKHCVCNPRTPGCARKIPPASGCAVRPSASRSRLAVVM